MRHLAYQSQQQQAITVIQHTRLYTARATLMRCFWPPLRLMPRSPISAMSPPFNISRSRTRAHARNVWECDIRYCWRGQVLSVTKHNRCCTPLSTMLPILQRQQKLTTDTCSDLAPQSASLCRRRGATTDLFVVVAVHGRTKQNVVLHRPVDDPRLPMNRLQGEGEGGGDKEKASDRKHRLIYRQSSSAVSKITSRVICVNVDISV